MFNDVMVITMEYVPGYKIRKVLGIVSGSTVRARHLGRDIVVGLRNIVGSEIKEYAEPLAQSRDEALKRVVEKAKSMGLTQL
ncbi:MAG: YbjQ family protein [Desulfurococcaceae archaeon]